MKERININQMSRPDRTPLVHVENEDLMPLPPPLDSS